MTGTPLRALEILSSVPPGCFLHVANDDANAPHVRAGEFVVVDGSDCEPINGELFLLEFGRGSPAGARRRIVETRLRHFEAVALA